MKKILCFTAMALLASPALAEEDVKKEISQLKQTSRAFAHVAKKVSPAVVQIRVEKDVERRSRGRNSQQEEFLRRFFGQAPERNKEEEEPRKRREEVGQGSGFIISEDGYVLTNNHVIGEADHIKVSLADGRELEAKVIGKDPKSDVAVVKVDAKDLPTLALGDSSKLEIGEWVMAIGNPFGLSHTVTAGIVSAKGRNSVGITDYENFIQTDAAINPGNSGGPLVDLDGNAVGINTAIFSQSGGYMGIGFAIPIDMVKNITEQLIADGSVTRGFIGIYMQELTSELAESFGVKSGILISQVSPGSPAEDAGLLSGDVIVKLKGKAIKNLADFRNKIAMEKPGDKILLDIIREDKEKEVKIVVGSRDKVLAKVEKYGLTVEETSSIDAKEFGSDLPEGLIITQVKANSIAEDAGLRAGMVIAQVNRRSVKTTKEYNEALSLKPGQALLLVKANGVSRYVLLKK
ncbi:Peptidase S1C, Do [Lentisphaera araneosa HTCC2155]|uniref:Probable periplasmic serine endoprotease DegP-like n=1 Tax=Lentisphaera araneosa HTCC2155 TaxID=313628 RepID=A6DR98_9BACT|nr:DegQ family serine endoprotease [Lentisphaera araneosa]EDM25845.1 Peptidase S1C, Do [Lentisphaera araneosa HTCC2155]